MRNFIYHIFTDTKSQKLIKNLTNIPIPRKISRQFIHPIHIGTNPYIIFSTKT